MYLVKLVLLACPVLIASMLLVANPAKAVSINSVLDTQAITAVSTQSISQSTTLPLTRSSNPIIDQLGCNCANCVQTKLQLLQGKLPTGNL
ncbi:conserved hypothetical protein [Trichormus variabilis ATCC 29413]|uniref:Uncharacterized protein n=2 Tax=Anabaena variabilis TaxID=264691 RepID=Q3MGH3_TRIV2|nr:MULTISPECIES: hypothetical protein [Nostocaceae]ABA19913.1 conserved hypothetical protein [Trichormus variabilis ATCC 29413]MBC1215881.1 hypothetical protein [Trichormus variabilis ARAD]MBC1258404.1 hypothetical protein [Trichormus variabilis V5]MBC1266290.1 hypothetical protein [Trichormus variabilis FSR]MBC1304508.1 hypothetical protein [Trichormus variabilis N2B]